MRENGEERREDMKSKLETLQHMKCWHEAELPRNEKVLHSKFVL